MEKGIAAGQKPKWMQRHGNRSERKWISGSKNVEATLDGTSVRGSKEEGKGRNTKLSSRSLRPERTKESKG